MLFRNLLSGTPLPGQSILSVHSGHEVRNQDQRHMVNVTAHGDQVFTRLIMKEIKQAHPCARVS